MERFAPGVERIAITAKWIVTTGERLGLAPERNIPALEQNIRATERFIRAIDEQWPAASCGTAAPESLWSHVTLGLPAITLRTSPPDTTAGGLSLTSLLDPNSVFFRTSVGESQP
ncbi:hypothetical protein [Streptomyces sp. NPDC126522]|uniref:hypothetical protein n=1 Tax=Streptomyces sp. NPDC126522 TaxID=3155211 RepID=UPI00331C5D80